MYLWGVQLEVMRGPSAGQAGAAKDQWVANEAGHWGGGGGGGALKDQMGWRGADGDQVGRWTGGTD